MLQKDPLSNSNRSSIILFGFIFKVIPLEKAVCLLQPNLLAIDIPIENWG